TTSCWCEASWLIDTNPMPTWLRIKAILIQLRERQKTNSDVEKTIIAKTADSRSCRCQLAYSKPVHAPRQPIGNKASIDISIATAASAPPSKRSRAYGRYLRTVIANTKAPNTSAVRNSQAQGWFTAS